MLEKGNAAVTGALAVLFVLFLILYLANRRGQKKRRLLLSLLLLSAWGFFGSILNIILGGAEGIHIELKLFPERVELFGISFAETSVYMWVITAVTLVLSLLFRFAVFSRFRLWEPSGFQNSLEACVELFDGFCEKTLGKQSNAISPYMFSIAVLMSFCAAFELLGLRAPTADIAVTFSLGLITFFLINIYSIRQKGILGRLRSLCRPSALMLPVRLISEAAVPVSLALRLFGNMLGGMIVTELLRGALGGYSIGAVPLAGLYFNLFHPIIQIYIFIILSMTFINEAME